MKKLFIISTLVLFFKSNALANGEQYRCSLALEEYYNQLSLKSPNVAKLAVLVPGSHLKNIAGNIVIGEKPLTNMRYRVITANNLGFACEKTIEENFVELRLPTWPIFLKAIRTVPYLSGLSTQKKVNQTYQPVTCTPDAEASKAVEKYMNYSVYKVCTSFENAKIAVMGAEFNSDKTDAAPEIAKLKNEVDKVTKACSRNIFLESKELKMSCVEGAGYEEVLAANPNRLRAEVSAWGETYLSTPLERSRGLPPADVPTKVKKKGFGGTKR